ncbi:MAG: type II toxin-antitoxin system RelE/ParE family toxin [Bacteroidales bacterium]|jgi:plasmid stabilization system protein ParE|nr:type II toxin-antitoxin system RelE/ParE family toxin [Bacteroidales bacterium]NLO51061.1 type II toxin-antitoxin system RelE/ParE family toxin [Bacteroidales bacterium]
MKLVYTEQALFSLEESLDLIAPKVSHEKIISTRNEILDAADSLILHPFQGQKETLLEDLGLGHRRLIVGHYKIIYRIIKEYIFITDIFDSRQDPDKMKS